MPSNDYFHHQWLLLQVRPLAGVLVLTRSRSRSMIYSVDLMLFILLNSSLL